MATARAMRRNMEASDNFPNDVVELLNYLGPPDPAARVRAFPGQDTQVPVWLLGSSLYGAQLAAYLGLPYAFASHFAPALLEDAADTYRSTFRASKWLDAPYFMMAAGVCAADTDDQAQYLRSSQILAFGRLRSGRPGKLPPPTHDLSEVSGLDRQGVDEALSCAAVGDPAAIRGQLAALIARHQPDEMLLTGMIHNHAARMHSFALAAQAMRALG